MFMNSTLTKFKIPVSNGSLVTNGRIEISVLNRFKDQLRFEVLSEASMKITVLWAVVSCSLVDVYRRLEIIS